MILLKMAGFYFLSASLSIMVIIYISDRKYLKMLDSIEDEYKRKFSGKI